MQGLERYVVSGLGRWQFGYSLDVIPLLNMLWREERSCRGGGAANAADAHVLLDHGHDYIIYHGYNLTECFDAYATTKTTWTRAVKLKPVADVFEVLCLSPREDAPISPVLSAFFDKMHLYLTERVKKGNDQNCRDRVNDWVNILALLAMGAQVFRSNILRKSWPSSNHYRDIVDEMLMSMKKAPVAIESVKRTINIKMGAMKTSGVDTGAYQVAEVIRRRLQKEGMLSLSYGS
jgi:hypothetical protein